MSKSYNNSLISQSRHTGIIVNDMKKSVYFYKNILGFKQLQDYIDDSDYINNVLGIKNGQIRMVKLQAKDGYIIELLKYLSHDTKLLNIPFYNVGICHLAFTISDSSLMYERLRREKVKIISKPLLSSEGTVKVFFCEDPNNIRIELVEILAV